MNNTAHSDIERLTDEIESQLLQLYRSPILTGDELRAALGFKSLDALRQSIARGTLPVPLFSMKNRRGKYALTKEVAQCLANERILNRCE